MWSPLKRIMVEYRALIVRMYLIMTSPDLFVKVGTTYYLDGGYGCYMGWVQDSLVAMEKTLHDLSFLRLSELRGFLLSSAEGETVTSLSVEASKKALEMANVDPEDIDLLLLCTSTLDDLFGVQKELGCSNALAFDLTTACSGFVLGLVTASCFIKAPIFKSCDSHCQHLENCTFRLFVKSGLSLYMDHDDMDHDDVVNYGSGCRQWVITRTACLDSTYKVMVVDRSILHVQVDNAICTFHNGATTSGIEIKLPARASYACLQMNGKEVFRGSLCWKTMGW
ncbi:unnamed protein product [Sphagnum jensenii]|uniref:Uncharacterized protein n=1 Tax=Sphagnum jensenii TaxID=128206 RepID=A0ABP0XCI6_9BRYO